MKKGVPHLIADVAPIGERLLVVDSAADKLLVDPSAGTVDREIAVLRNPYGMLVSPGGDSVFVSGWSTAQVAEYRLSDGIEAARITVGAHPTDMVWLPPSGARTGGREGDDDGPRPEDRSPRLGVACANTNYVYVLGKDRETWRVQEKVSVAMTPRQPVGMTPSSLSVSPDKRRLYIACSDGNAVAVADISGSATRLWATCRPAGTRPPCVPCPTDACSC